MPTPSATARTQPALWGAMTRRYGSFSGKTEVAAILNPTADLGIGVIDRTPTWTTERK